VAVHGGSQSSCFQMGNLEEILANKQFPPDFQNTGSMIAW
jgi:hypothetical protein